MKGGGSKQRKEPTIDREDCLGRKMVTKMENVERREKRKSILITKEEKNEKV